MLRVWLAWGAVVAQQISNGAAGQLDWAGPYGGPMYGERVVHVLACLVQAFYFQRNPGPQPTGQHFTASAAALSACVAALAATPEPTRFAYPAVMGWLQLSLFLQAACWAGTFQGRARNRANIVAVMQGLGFALFVYAQVRIGLTPVGPDDPVSALYYLHGPWVDLAPAVLGTALLAWASRHRA